MTPPGEQDGVRPQLNESQRRRLLVSCQYVDRLLVDIETVLAVAASGSPFARYHDDLAPAQKTLLRDYIARIRRDLVRVLARHGLEPAGAPVGVTHAVRTSLGFVDIAIEELRPQYMRGYGAVPAELVPELEGLVEELQAVVRSLDAALASGGEADFAARLARLEAGGADVGVLQTLERIVARHGLVEFRPALDILLDRLEDRRLEIAVFGRVSSGKSSLLNYVLGAPVLPVGVTPITAVPTRLVYGPEPELRVRFADRRAERLPLARLAEFVTEQENPGNTKHVTQIVVALPSPRLRAGVVFVDTPGLGSLATSGAAETLAYLPRCDVAVMLVDATAPLTPEDVATLERLFDAAIPATVLLSKADLLAPADLARVTRYAEAALAERFGSSVPVRAVSVAAGFQHLAEAWVASDLEAWLGEHARLAERSLRRKIGALKARVEAALRVRLERAERRGGPPPAAGPEIETELRAAAAAFETTRRALEALRETPPELRREAIAAGARAIVDGLRAAPASSGSLDAALRGAIAQVAARRAEDAWRALEALAGRTAAALGRGARAVGLPPPEETWAAQPRELPQVDLGAVSLEVPGPLVRVLGARLGEWWVARTLRVRLAPQLDAALAAHGRLVHRWALGVLEGLRRAFEAEAQVLRAHLAALAEEPASGGDDREALARDLASLTGTAEPGREA